MENNSSSTSVNRPDLAAQHALAVSGGHSRRPSQTSRHPSLAGVDSDSSSSSQVTTLSRNRPGMYDRSSPMASSSSLASLKSGTSTANPFEPPVRRASPGHINVDLARSNRAKHRSQGFFEPTIPSASPTMPNSASLTPSQIAAQAAMHGPNPTHLRKRSQTIPELGPAAGSGRRKPSIPSPVPPVPPLYSNSSHGYSESASSTGTSRYLGVNTQGATTAANVVFPRSPLPSPTPSQDEIYRAPSPVVLEKDAKPGKEKSRMKLFSKPKHITLVRDKDSDKKSLSSPKKQAGIGNLAQLPHNRSTTSLAESTMSGPSSFYSLTNGSSSTLTPAEGKGTGEREKLRHHFLHRRQKKDHDLALSSAASNSRPVDANATQIYSFAPASPGPKSKFDLRHAARSRDKRKEDKSVAFNLGPSGSAASGLGIGFDSNPRDREQSFANAIDVNNTTSSNLFGLPSGGSAYSADISAGYSVQGLAADDAWPLFRARILNIFEGEDIRVPVEDFNRLMTVHLHRCIQRRAPHIILDDVRDLFRAGFGSLDHTLRQVPDDRLVPHLVDMWLFVFGTILPFMQAVFLPLDLELRGHGSILSAREAQEFWGELAGLQNSRPMTAATTSSSSSSATTIRDRAQSNAASSRPRSASQNINSSRTLLLTAFRDVVILPRHATLLIIFSRLSLENINAAPLDATDLARPGTAASNVSFTIDPASYNSQSSTLLDSSAASASSFGARSRATSNTSAGSFNSLNSRRNAARARSDSRSALESHPALQAQVVAGQRDHAQQGSAKVAQTAARMLQCISVLASLPSNSAWSARHVLHQMESASSPDDGSAAEATAPQKMARLAEELKLNWLARGRTGRNRRGFVGSKARNLHIGGVSGGGLSDAFSAGMGEGIGIAA